MSPSSSHDAQRALFQEVILDHYRRPRNRRQIEGADVTIHTSIPSCGDELTLQLRLEADRIAAIGFTGQGCSISLASASMMTERAGGLTSQEARDLVTRFRAMLHQGPNAAPDPALGPLTVLSGVARFPVRVKCAMLAWAALEDALAPPPEG